MILASFENSWPVIEEARTEEDYDKENRICLPVFRGACTFIIRLGANRWFVA
jgi:hypothetical protein